MGNKFNPTSCRLTHQQRAAAVDTGTCSDGMKCGEIRIYGPRHCDDCPNMPDDESEWALLDKRLNGRRDTGDVVIDTKLDADAKMDALINMLCLRCDDLQSERQAALDENDALRAENVDLRKELAEAHKQLAMMRGA